MSDGFYRPKYVDRHGATKAGKFWWARDPVTGERVSTGCRDLAAAQAWRAQRELIRANPAHAAAHAASLADWLDALLKSKSRKPQGTQKMYRTHAGHLLRVWGQGAPLAVISPAGVDRYLEQRRSEGASESTLGKELTTIRQTAKLAARSEAWAGNVSVLQPADFSPGYVPRTRRASRAELDLLRAHLAPERWAFVAFCVCTSARLGEAKRFTRRDWDPVARVVKLRGTKTAASAREVPLVSVFDELWEHVELYAPFAWADPTKDLPYQCRKLGIEPLTPNDLRRTCASWLRAAGVHVDVIAKVLGHSTSVLVERVYGQLSPADLRYLIEGQVLKPSKTAP